MLDGVERECRNLGYEMSVCNLDYRSDDYEEQLKWLLPILLSIILLGTELLDDDIAPYKTSKSHILCLDYSNSDMDFDCVLINNSDSAKMATEHLIDRGHREIGYLRGSFRQAFPLQSGWLCKSTAAERYSAEPAIHSNTFP